MKYNADDENRIREPNKRADKHKGGTSKAILRLLQSRATPAQMDKLLNGDIQSQVLTIFEVFGTCTTSEILEYMDEPEEEILETLDNLVESGEIIVGGRLYNVGLTESGRRLVWVKDE